MTRPAGLSHTKPCKIKPPPRPAGRNAGKVTRGTTTRALQSRLCNNSSKTHINNAGHRRNGNTRPISISNTGFGSFRCCFASAKSWCMDGFPVQPPCLQTQNDPHNLAFCEHGDDIMPVFYCKHGWRSKGRGIGGAQTPYWQTKGSSQPAPTIPHCKHGDSVIANRKHGWRQKQWDSAPCLKMK